MGPALAVAQPAPKLGVVLVALAAAGVLLDRDPRRRAVFMVAALVLAAVLLVGHIADTDQFHSISDDARKLVSLCLAGGAAVGGLAVLFTRRPEALPLLAVAVLPFRVPVAAAGSTANLLVPLYLVIAAGAWPTRGAVVTAAARPAWSRRAAADDRPRRRAALRVRRALRAAIALPRDFDQGARAGRLLLRAVRAALHAPAGGRVVAGALLGCVGVLVALALVFRGSGSGSTSAASFSGTRR